MLQTGLIPNAHSDLVTDAAYDFYGLRLATCSLDQRYVLCFHLRDATQAAHSHFRKFKDKNMATR